MYDRWLEGFVVMLAVAALGVVVVPMSAAGVAPGRMHGVRTSGGASASPAATPVEVSKRRPGDQTAHPAPEDPGGATKRVRARRVPARTGSPRIDGRLDEEAWAQAEAATDFVQMRPDPGDPASQRTRVRVLYDAEAIYVGMRLYDDPNAVTTQLARRDASGVLSDWAHVMIDSYHDNRTAFRFSVTPSGTKKDVLHFDDTSEDLNWDAVWDAAAVIDEEGWTAEFRIPLSQLRFSTEDGAAELVWGINFGREIAREGEWSWWSPVLPEVSGFVSRSGELTGLARLESPTRLELLPYSVARATRAPADPSNPFYEATDGVVSAGLDVRYGLTSNLTLSATVNPDFGQVEADPSVVNLSAYETFFPEKRPFFMEGSNIFQFGIGYDDGSGESLFYSRRIGRRPQRRVSVDGWVDSPDATTIMGAAKLSGKTSSGWTVGLLNATTAEEVAEIAESGGATSTAPVEPRTNYMVGSVSRDFRDGDSSLGMLFTATHRALGGDDTFDFLPSDAYAFGVRGRHRFADDTWQFSAYVAGSHVRGGETAMERIQRAPGHYYQRPDADHIELDPTRTSLTGAVGNFGLWKVGGGSFRGGVGGHLRTPGFEVNDLGYQREADQGLLFGNLRYHQFEPRWIFRNFTVGLNPSMAWTTGGDRTWTQIGHFTNFELTNFWNGGWWLGPRFSALEPGALRGGPAIRRPAGLRYSFWLNGDRRKPVVWHLNGWGGTEYGSGGHDIGISPSVTVRPSGRMNLSIGPQIRWNQPTWQYVTAAEADGETHYVFADLDQTTVSLTTRMNLTISPTLSLELYAQPFVSGGDYSGFKRVADPRAESFADRFDAFTGDRIAYDEDAGIYSVDADGDGVRALEFADPDFNFRQMRGNAVLRWEYMPGSTLYLVWSQDRTGYVGGGAGGAIFDAGRDFGRLFNTDDAFPTPATNIFMVKVDYWLSL